MIVDGAYICAFCDARRNRSTACPECGEIDGAMTFDEWIRSAS